MIIDGKQAYEKIRFDVGRVVYESCFERGTFLLAGGDESDYYLDLRKMTYSPDVVLFLPLIHYLICDSQAAGTFCNYDAVGGPGLGAAGLVGAWASRVGGGRNFVVRSKAKDHGNQNPVVGSVKSGDKVLLLEDVTTSGGSVVRAVETMRSFGCDVLAVFGLVDRGVGKAKTLLDAIGVPFVSVWTIVDILQYENK